MNVKNSEEPSRSAVCVHRNVPQAGPALRLQFDLAGHCTSGSVQKVAGAKKESSTL